MMTRSSYLILAECKWHAFVITSDLDIAIAEDLEGIVHRVLELVVALC